MSKTPVSTLSLMGVLLLSGAAAAQDCGPRGSGYLWQDVGGGLNDEVRCFEVYDEDGSGPLPPALYVGGKFTSAGGVPCSRVAKWDGHTWSAVGTNFPGSCGVASLAWFDDDGAGPNPPMLYAATCQNDILRITLVYRLNGQTWEVPPGAPLRGYSIRQILVFGGQLWARGSLDMGFTSSRALARYNGSTWRDSGDASNIAAMGVDPSTGRLILGGFFTGVFAPNTPSVPNANTAYLAAWTGANWVNAGAISPAAPVTSFGLLDPDGPGSGPAYLYAGRVQTAATSTASRLIRKSAAPGSAWEVLPDNTPPGIVSFSFGAAFDDDGPGPRPTAYYGGVGYADSSAPPSDPFSYLARFDPTTNTWSPLEAGGLAGSSDTPFPATRLGPMVSYDPDGDGPELPSLYIGGSFQTVGGTPVNHIAMLAEAPCSTPLAPVISPAGAVFEGTDISISVQPWGLGPYTYRWFHDGIELASENSCTIRKLAAPSDAGSYTVEVTRAHCVQTSSSVILAVGAACPADFNRDNRQDADDLSDFVTCFFAAPTCDRTDFNGDSEINPDDLADFVTAFFGGTC